MFEKVHFFAFFANNFEQRELHGKATHLFVDLNDVHLPSKFHVYSKGVERSKTTIFRHFEFEDLPKIQKLTLPLGGYT